MKMLVDYILKGSSPDGDGKSVGKDEEVLMEQEKLQQLCLYQLVLGYNLQARLVLRRAVRERGAGSYLSCSCGHVTPPLSVSC